MNPGRVALVTGGGRGIGSAIARTLAADSWRVVLAYGQSVAGATTVVQQIVAAGGTAVALQADLTDATQVRTLVDRAHALFGRLDSLVNNAAIFNGRRLSNLTLDDWERVHATNLRAPFLCTQAAVPYMLAQEPPGGAIVMIASDWGLDPRAGEARVSAAYAAAKAGLIGMTRALAHELAPAIRVNAIAPGFIDAAPDKFNPQQRVDLPARTPLQRLGTSDDVASLVSFLVDSRSSFITGQVISVDGGLVMH